MAQAMQAVLARVVPSGGKAYLFGSQARGDARPDSDWDVLVLLDKERITQQDHEAISYPLFDLSIERDALVSPKLYTMEEWERRRSTPFYKSVMHDCKSLL